MEKSTRSRQNRNIPVINDMKYFFLIVLFTAGIVLSSATGQVISIDDFEDGLKPKWESRKFKGGDSIPYC